MAQQNPVGESEHDAMDGSVDAWAEMTISAGGVAVVLYRESADKSTTSAVLDECWLTHDEIDALVTEGDESLPSYVLMAPETAGRKADF
jgi:hypothetical protein